MRNLNSYTPQLAESSHCFSDLWNEGYYDGKGQMEATRTASPRKIVNQKHHFIPGGVAEISGTIKDLKEGVVISNTAPFNSHTWFVQKTVRFWRMTVDYHKLNQKVIPTEAIRCGFIS